MRGHDIVVIGASAGGVEALMQLVRDLPADLPAAVFIVLHVPPNGLSALPAILGRVSNLPTTHTHDGQPIQAGHIYVAPPDNHLLIEDGIMYLTPGPRENNHRPAIDPLFRSAARAYGSQVIGVILSGALDDGTAGLWAIKARNGLAVVQDPADAFYPGMPRSAIENVDVDYIVPLSEISSLLTRLVNEPSAENAPLPDTMAMEAGIAEMNAVAIHDPERPGIPSEYACPDCGGTLWQLKDGDIVRYRCRTGHAYSPESLLAAQSDALEGALWAALRALEERASLARRIAEQSQRRGNQLTAHRFTEQAENALGNAETIRKVLLTGITSQEAELPDNKNN